MAKSPGRSGAQDSGVPDGGAPDGDASPGGKGRLSASHRLWRLLEATEPLRRHPWAGDVAGIVLFALALAARLAVEGVLPPGFPYVTFFPAVVITTFVAGLRPGITCAILSGFAAWYFFMRTGMSDPGAVVLALGFYVFVVTVDIVLIHVMQRTLDRLSAERKRSAALYEQQRIMFQELQHRVANNMQFVAALLSLQERRAASDPGAAVEALKQAGARLQTFARIHRRLYDPASLDLPIGRYLGELCSDLAEAAGTRQVRCRVNAPDTSFTLDRLTLVSLLVAELVTNALKHAFAGREGGTITIDLAVAGADAFVLTIADDGHGIAADFDPAASQSLGFRIAQGLAGQLGGRLTFSSDNGTVARLEVPGEA